MKSDESIFIETANTGREYYIENIKLLLFKENPDIFELIDFENEQIYQEPLLFAFFNFPGKSNLTLENLLYGYMNPDLRPDEMSVISDEYARIYLANIGWMIAPISSHAFTIRKDANFDLHLFDNGKEVHFEMEPLQYVGENGPEIVKHPIKVLRECYLKVDDELVEFDVTEITKKKTDDLVEAWRLMKELIPDQYDLIRSLTKKMVVFELIDGTANSFATRNAQGTAFFHSYQEEYNEVFFMDDIAHQTGHVVFYAITAEPETYIKLAPDTFLQEFTTEINQGSRTVYVLFHAMYTYYTTMKFLDKALEKNVFDGVKDHEARGRMNFYIEKFARDKMFLEESIGVDNLFTEQGLKLWLKIKTDVDEISKLWKPKVKHFDIENQPYNFTYSLFAESNSIENLISK